MTNEIFKNSLNIPFSGLNENLKIDETANDVQSNDPYFYEQSKVQVNHMFSSTSIYLKIFRSSSTGDKQLRKLPPRY